MRLANAWPGPVVLGGALAVSAAALLGEPGSGRTLLVAVFLIFGPGLALVGLLELDDQWALLALAFALSVALDTAVALVLIYITGWSPEAGLAVLLGVSAAGALAQIARASRGGGVG